MRVFYRSASTPFSGAFDMIRVSFADNGLYSRIAHGHSELYLVHDDDGWNRTPGMDGSPFSYYTRWLVSSRSWERGFNYSVFANWDVTTSVSFGMSQNVSIPAVRYEQAHRTDKDVLERISPARN